MSVEGDLDHYIALHMSVKNSLVNLWFCKDKGDLTPHLTEGRIKKKPLLETEGRHSKRF